MLLVLDIIFDLWFLVVMLSTLCRPVVTTDGLHKDKASILRQFWRKTFPVYIFPMCFLYLFVVMDVPFWVRRASCCNPSFRCPVLGGATCAAAS